MTFRPQSYFSAWRFFALTSCAFYSFLYTLFFKNSLFYPLDAFCRLLFDADGDLCGLGMANNLCFWYELIMTMILNMVYSHSFAAYFIIQSPGNATQMVNNAANLISWQKGVDNVVGFDLEMTRMTVDGLFLIARNGEYVD